MLTQGVWFTMNKYIITILALALILVGCTEYQKYDVTEEDLSLIDEIAKIENELANSDNPDFELSDEVEETVEEEIVIPNPKEEQVLMEDALIVSVKENEAVKLNVKVTDPDEDPVTYTFTSPLDENGEWKTNYGDAGEYLVTISATDGKLTTEKRVNIVVERVNVPPVIAGVIDIVVKEGETVTFEPTVTDPNNDAVSINVAEPLTSGTFVTDHTSAGEYAITVLATDGELDSEKSFKLTVHDVNEKPIITEVEDITIEEGGVVTIKPIISDLDEDPIVLTISQPVGDDGIWETAYTDHGEYKINIVADDGKDRVTQQITVVIEDVNKAPEIVDISLQ
jgi:PBP1b-binding outer membrane lipoprotein LpoB